MRRFLLCCILGLSALAGRAAGDRTCDLREVKVEPLSNGLRIRITADGLLNTAGDWGAVHSYNAEDASWSPACVTRMTVRLTNVRGGVGPLVPVARYPVSHLEFALPKGGEAAAGLLCTLVLYTPAQWRTFAGGEGPWDDAPFGGGPQVAMVGGEQQDTLLILVTSDRPSAEEAFARPYQPAPTSLAVSGTREQLVLRAQHAPLAEVLDALARQAGAPIFLDGAEACRVTACLAGQSLERTLALLAQAYGLIVSPRADGYAVSDAEITRPTAFDAARVRALPLRALTPEVAQALLPDVLLPLVRPNATANALMVSGPAYLTQKIAADLQALDVPARQCRLQATIILFDARDTAVRDVLLAASGGTTQLRAGGEGPLSVSFGPHRTRDLLAQIQALETRSPLRIVTVPAISVATGRPAQLFVGERLYFWKLLGTSDDYTLTSVEAGTRLQVTPYLGRDEVVVDLLAENTTRSQATALGPRLNVQQARCRVRLLPGQPLQIGGVSVRERSAGRRATPLPPAGRRERADTRLDACILIEADAW